MPHIRGRGCEFRVIHVGKKKKSHSCREEEEEGIIIIFFILTWDWLKKIYLKLGWKIMDRPSKCKRGLIGLIHVYKLNSIYPVSENKF